MVIDQMLRNCNTHKIRVNWTCLKKTKWQTVIKASFEFHILPSVSYISRLIPNKFYYFIFSSNAQSQTLKMIRRDCVHIRFYTLLLISLSFSNYHINVLFLFHFISFHKCIQCVAYFMLLFNVMITICCLYITNQRNDLSHSLSSW